jgi:hypothetical protein
MNKNQIRLEPDEIEAITTSFRNIFSNETDHLWVFGSRVKPNARGGDIDLYIETTSNAEQAGQQKIELVIDLWDKIGEQKIDVVVHLLHSNYQSPIYEIAKQEGIKLI